MERFPEKVAQAGTPYSYAACSKSANLNHPRCHIHMFVMIFSGFLGYSLSEAKYTFSDFYKIIINVYTTNLISETLRTTKNL